MSAILTVPVFGTTEAQDEEARGLEAINLPLIVRQAKLIRNDHNHADELRLTAEHRDCGIDPRFLKNATVEFWLGDAGPSGEHRQTDKTHRFIGIATQVRRYASQGAGFTVDMEFLDYTTLFIAQKPLVAEGIPNQNMSLTEAWNLICNNTGWFDLTSGKIISNCLALTTKLEGRGVSLDTVIGEAAPARFRKLGLPIPVKPDMSSWDVWNVCCGMLGLITFIDGSTCVVTTTTEHYKPGKAPRMVWGHNLLDAEESTNIHATSKGVGLTSYDPEKGAVIEAFFPPPGSPLIRVKRTKAKGQQAGEISNSSALQSDQYEMFEYNMSITEERLQVVAENAFAERARQELEGKIITCEMSVDTVTQEQFDLLNLHAGDPIRIEIDPDLKETLLSIPSEEERVNYLIGDRGYSPSVALLISRNATAFGGLRNDYHVKQADISLTEDHFEVTIYYHNYIDIRNYVQLTTPGPVV
jgi:hypothetical protein